MADGGSKLIIAAHTFPPPPRPLALAAMHGLVKEVIDCLDTGVRVDEKDSNGWTALHFAAAQGHTSVLSLLLAQGADPLAKTSEGATAKSLAMGAGRIEASVLLDKAEETGQVILQKDLPDHVKDLKRQVADLTEMFNALAGRLPAPDAPAAEEKPILKSRSLLISR